MEKWEEEEPAERPTHAPIFRKEKHLSTALLTSEIDYYDQYKKYPEKIKHEHRQQFAETGDKHYKSSKEFIPNFLRSFLKGVTQPKKPSG